MSPWYESVQETLNQLTFPQTGYPNLYLNQKRLGDRFLGKLGAIDTFSKSVETTGGANAKLKAVVAEATLESARGRHATINWNLSDSLAQALVLRAYLESAGELRTEPRAAMMMDFVLVGGPGGLVHPDFVPDHANWPRNDLSVKAASEVADEVQKQVRLGTSPDHAPAYWVSFAHAAGGTVVSTLGTGSVIQTEVRQWAWSGGKYCIFGQKVRDWDSWTLVSPLHVWIEPPGRSRA